MAFEKLVNCFFFSEGRDMSVWLIDGGTSFKLCTVTQNRKEAACVQENSYNLTNIMLSKDKLFFAIEVTLKLNSKLIAVL